MSMMKKCCTCGLDRPKTEFNRQAKAHDGLQSRCRACCAEWYTTHKPAHIKNVAELKRKLRREQHVKFCEYLTAHPCIDCGEADLRVLDCDHRDPSLKRSNVGTMITSGYPWRTIAAEIAKCDVRCSNCHRRRTSGDLGWWRTPAEVARREAVTVISRARLLSLFGR
jgi:hypothetical protein